MRLELTCGYGDARPDRVSGEGERTGGVVVILGSQAMLTCSRLLPLFFLPCPSLSAGCKQAWLGLGLHIHMRACLRTHILNDVGRRRIAKKNATPMDPSTSKCR